MYIGHGEDFFWELLEENRKESSEPDSAASKAFQDVRLVTTDGAAVNEQIGTLLMPRRDMSSKALRRKTSFTAWSNWRFPQPGVLSIQNPDSCITFKASPFAFAQQRQLGSLYLDKAGISAILFLEVTTALQARKSLIEKMPTTLSQHQSEASFSNERPISTGSCSVKVGSSLSRTIPAEYGSKAGSIFFNSMMRMANQYGNAKLIKQIPFAIATEQEVETVRTYMLNMMKYASDEGLRQLKDDSSKA